MEVRPLSGAVGAEILGVDVSRVSADGLVEDIRQAFLEHLVVFFRDQQLSPEQFQRFAARFGQLDAHHVLRGMEGHPDILEIVRKETDRYIFAPGWHTDVTWQEKPVLGAMLYGVELPTHGGDTLFANQYLAYESLSAGMQRMLSGLRAVHSAERTYGANAELETHVHLIKVDRAVAMRGRSTHPVVRTHPETGRKGLFGNPSYTFGFENMTTEESRGLLDYLYRHASRPEFSCRFRWRPGSLAFWDNRCVMHCPIDDYFGTRRRTWRITLLGDRPA